MNIKREVELLKSMGFNVTEASLQAEKDMHAARVAEDLKHRAENEREAVEIAETVAWVGQEPTSNHEMLVRAGVVNSDGSLKPYIATGHKSEPLPAFEDLYGDDLVF